MLAQKESVIIIHEVFENNRWIVKTTLTPTENTVSLRQNSTLKVEVLTTKGSWFQIPVEENSMYGRTYKLSDIFKKLSEGMDIDYEESQCLKGCLYLNSRRDIPSLVKKVDGRYHITSARF